MTRSNNWNRPDQVIAKPATPWMTAHAQSGMDGIIADIAKAHDDVPAAPYTNPQIMAYTPK